MYLDFRDPIARLGRHTIKERYGNLFDMYQRITGEDPYTVPMRIYPAIHYTMGGLWVDYNLTNSALVACSTRGTAERTSPMCCCAAFRCGWPSNCANATDPAISSPARAASVNFFISSTSHMNFWLRLSIQF